MHDLLREALLTWRAADGAKYRATLPGLLAALADGRCVDFPQTRPHQHHPWAMFLTQVAAHALQKAGLETPPNEEIEWRALLLDLSGSPEAWHLVVEDLAKPAFMQPPVPEGALEKKKSEKKKSAAEPWAVIPTPDRLDMLVTSKAHDVKEGLISVEDLEGWVYALVTLQTMQGYPGRGYNGIARMNGGYGNRPRVGLSPGLDTSSRFRRDLRTILGGWDETLRTRGYQREGVRLAWLEAWDGAMSFGTSDLAPHFVEVCQRIRLESHGRGLVARKTTSQQRRCAPEIDGGDVADPWAPIKRSDSTAFTVGPSGFSYERLTELFFAETFEEAPAQALQPDDPAEVWFLASAMARGQGKTEGLHERTLRLRSEVRRKLGLTPARDTLAARAKERVARADLVRKKILFPAIKKLAPGAAAPQDHFQSHVDEIFFEQLFESHGDDDASARLAWDVCLLEVAQAEIQRLIDVAPLPDSRRYRAIADAEGIFGAGAAKHSPDAWSTLRRQRPEPLQDKVPV